MTFKNIKTTMYSTLASHTFRLTKQRWKCMKRISLKN